MGYREKTSDEYSQGESQSPRPVNRGNSNILHATNDLIRVKGRYSPGRILAITICSIALAEVIAMIVVYYFIFWPYYLQVLLDATVMVVIIFPVLYFLSFRPLLVHIQQRYQAENITQARLRLMQFANTHTLDELLQVTLDEIESLTGSTIGFFHFLESDQKTLWLQAWSTNTLQNMCKAEGKDSHYDVEQAGVWADCIRQRQPVIHNDYASLPHRKGMPEGHALVIREMAVPIMRDKKIMAILGLGNKPQAYTANDVEVVSTFADFAWDIVDHKRTENALRKSEEKFRTLVDWTYDWEKWLDPRGNIVYTSPSCERITGYSPEEFIEDPDLLTRIVHPDDRQSYEEHHRVVHDESVGPMNIEYRIIARDGSEHWIEHVCRPLFGLDSRYLGRRVSNRDITERKRIEEDIRERNQKEKTLTQMIHNMQMEIARDLHDTLGQNISFLLMNLEHLSETKLSDQTAMQIQIQTMTKAAKESYELIRGMLAVLQSGNSADPLNLFTRYAEQVAERSSSQIDITSQGNPKQLSPHQMLQLFYIFREALSNIEKYANPSRVSGEFTWDENALAVVISDNGRGFDPNHIQSGDHYGIKFMRERAELLNGSLSIQSSPGMGTKITVHIPYKEGSFTKSQ
jgi:PAS domain S-box-containing protein